MKDELGDRMKKNYENRTRILLPRRTYTLIRIDGKAFHTYTKGCDRPFDSGLIDDMDNTAIHLCKNIQGAVIGFVQSDEISILVTDFAKHETDAWFDGNIQKIVSVSASLAASKFNQLRMLRDFNSIEVDSVAHGQTAYDMAVADIFNKKLADFDARTFTIPSKSEVMNYFIWRQQDTVRNSISSVAQSLYSSKKLEGKNMSVQQEMIIEKGLDWNNFAPIVKRGRFVYKKEITLETPYEGIEIQQKNYKRNVWVADECPTFTAEPLFLDGFVPEMS